MVVETIKPSKTLCKNNRKIETYSHRLEDNNNFVYHYCF